jgi:hypothetical protein
MENFWIASAPELTIRSLCILPVWNWNFENPAFGVQVAPFVTREQLNCPEVACQLTSCPREGFDMDDRSLKG